MQNNIMPKALLGQTGLQATRFGLGGFHQCEISSEHVAEVVDAYLAEGGNYIETARNYGNGASEAKIGQALQGRRDQVILCSKSPAATADDALRDIEASLQALQTDHLDVYLFHGVDPERLAKLTKSNGAVHGFVRARDEGMIRHIGISTHHPELYLDAFEQLPIELILIWCNYLDNLNFPLIPETIIPEAKRRGIAITAMKPLADGFLYRSVEPAVRYCLGSGPDIAVSGSNSVEQVRQVARAVRQTPADAAGRAEILRTAPELGCYVCRRCGQCGDVLMETFRLEGEFDRQMIDFAPVGPAENALRKVLSGWFAKAESARKAFAAKGWTLEQLLAQAARATCSYGIDLERKTRLAVAKLTDNKQEYV